MHSSDHELQSLLCEDESSQELQAVALHVETCVHCQNRLGQLTGIGNWTKELVTSLRDDAQRESPSDESTVHTPPITVVLDQIADLEDNPVELDPLSLDFLGPPSHPELLGRLGRYEIERVIGAGGMGLVLKGYDAELHRPVAVKVLAPHLAHSAAARKRFAREAQATAAVIHPHVIPIHNVEASDKLPYLVMSYINGSSLQWYVDTNGPLPIDQTLRIAIQTVSGLRAAHAQGLIHRDVKPANILLEEGTLRVVLSDFGLARTMDDASLTRTGIVTGTPHYMSPEQAGGDAIDSRSDLFSLGCVFYFMLTGRPPFRAATAMGVLNRICHEAHRPVREVNALVPVPLAKIIDRLLSKQASDRYASAEELETALCSVMQALQAGRLKMNKLVALPMQWSHVERWARKWPVMLAAVALIASLVSWSIFGLSQNSWHESNTHVGPRTITPDSRNNAVATKDEWEKQLSSLWSDIQLLEQRETTPMTSIQWIGSSTEQSYHEIELLEGELRAIEREQELINAWMR